MRNRIVNRPATTAFWLAGSLCLAFGLTATALVDPIPAGWTLIEDNDPGWTISGGASYVSTDEIPQLKERLPKGNNSHIGIWESVGATAEITFQGTGVRVYGYQPGEGGKADISIDKKLAQAGVVWDPKAAFESNHLFFEKTGLPEGKHTLTIKTVESGFETQAQGGASVANIDYIFVQGKGAVSPDKPAAGP